MYIGYVDLFVIWSNKIEYDNDNVLNEKMNCNNTRFLMLFCCDKNIYRPSFLFLFFSNQVSFVWFACLLPPHNTQQHDGNDNDNDKTTSWRRHTMEMQCEMNEDYWFVLLHNHHPVFFGRLLACLWYRVVIEKIRGYDGVASMDRFLQWTMELKWNDYQTDWLDMLLM